MALPPPQPKQTGAYTFTGPTDEEVQRYLNARDVQQPPSGGDANTPTPSRDIPVEPDPGVPAPPPEPHSAPMDALPPPPPMSPAGSAFEGSFVQPGMREAAAFRTPEFFQGRIAGPPRLERMGPGATVDLSGRGMDAMSGNPFAGADAEDVKRRLLAAIMGGRG